MNYTEEAIRAECEQSLASITDRHGSIRCDDRPLPEWARHITFGPGVAGRRALGRLGIAYRPAMVGWRVHRGRAYPIFRGVIVHEAQEGLIEAARARARAPKSRAQTTEGRLRALKAAETRRRRREEAIQRAKESRAVWRAIAERARQGHGHPLVVVFFGLADLLRRQEEFRRGRTRAVNQKAVDALRVATRSQPPA